MIQAMLDVVGATTFSVDVDIRLFDTTGVGIKKITVTDKDDFEIPVGSQPEGCPARHVVSLSGIPRTRMPIYVSAINCEDVETGKDANGPLGNISFSRPNPLPCSALLCEDDIECATANNEFTDLRNQLSRKCAECRSLRKQKENADILTVFYFLLAVAILVVAAIISAIPFGGQIGGAILVAAAVAISVLGIIHSNRSAALRKKIKQCERELANLQERLDAAIRSVQNSCCPGCYSDLIVPC